MIQLTAGDAVLSLPDDSFEASRIRPPQCPSIHGCDNVPLISGVNFTTWNLVGLPQDEQQIWSDALIIATGCEDGCTPNQAGQNGADVFHQQLWSFDAAAKSYTLVENDAPLTQWKGYWGAATGNTDNVQMMFPRSNPSVLAVTTSQIVATDNAVISGKHFQCNASPYQALIITGDNVKIEDNLFTDCYAGIIIAGAENTLIKGNRFENIGVAIREKDQSSGTVITHNEFEGVGVFNCTETPEWGWHTNGYWACDVFQSAGGANGKFNFNIIDNRGYQTRWIEDFVNLYGNGGGFEVKDNVFIGSSEPDSSSPAGGCVVIDGVGSHFDIERNSCYETAGYGIATAGGSHATFLDNTIYISREHGMTLSQHPSNNVPAGSFGMASTNFSGRPCGENVQITGNSVFAHRVDVFPGELPVDGEETRNLTGSCPVILDRNNFHETDPLWTIPSNVFDTLDNHYFSARRGLVQ